MILEKDQIVYFYYDNMIPCQKGRIKEEIVGGYKVNWLNDNDKSTGSSSVPIHRVFSTTEECTEYSNSIENMKEKGIRNNLNSQEDVLIYMYNLIWSEDYDFTTEKRVLRDKIEEFFDVIIER